MENYFNAIILKKMISFLLFPFREMFLPLSIVCQFVYGVRYDPRWKFHYFHKYKFILKICYLEFQPENVVSEWRAYKDHAEGEKDKQNKTSKKNHQCNYLVLVSFLAFVLPPTPINEARLTYSIPFLSFVQLV